MSEAVAVVLLTLELTDEQLRAAQLRAARLDALNLGTDDPPESYSASLALARILASDSEVVVRLIPSYTEGYIAEPQEEPDSYPPST